jgi:transcriptional regulator with XRE-family HTH domain
VINKELLYRELGMRLANERRRRGLSQAQFAAKVSLSRTSITNIECGRQPIQIHQLFQFASILQVEPGSLLPKLPSPAQTVALIPDHKEAQYLAEIDSRFLANLIPQSGDNAHVRQGQRQSLRSPGKVQDQTPSRARR